jgi:epoxyqueuosine reductase
MERRLKRVEARVHEHLPGLSPTRRYVDTGPVLERELAARAGLGSVGKNTNLLDPEMGSWFLLGEIFLPLELQPAVPAADLCGSCSLCLEACPTGALPEPYRLDSRRCISYWTIEHRGAIPEQVRPQLEGWVFGCDVCQEVCPLNTATTAIEAAEFQIPDNRRALDLPGLLRMGRDEYVETFRHSAMKRAKLSGLKRNAAVAMGNSGSADFVESLSEALMDSEPVVRGHAAWALGRIGGDSGRQALKGALKNEEHPEVRSEIVAALEVLG